MSGSDTGSRRQDRPARVAPNGTGQGLAAIMILAAALPFLGLMAGAMGSRRGVDAWLDGIGWAVALTVVLIVPPLFGGLWRRWWSLCWMWCVAALLLVAYPACLLLAAAVPLHWRPARSGDELFLAHYALGGIILCGPACWWLLRYLRLRYAQPWTLPEEWETDEARAPGWSIAVLRALKPDAAAAVERARGEKDAGDMRPPPPLRRPR